MFVHDFGSGCISQRLLELISSHNQICDFKKGDKLDAHGKGASNAYFVLTGLLRLYIPYENGNEKTISYMGYGSLAGDSIFFSGRNPKVISCYDIFSDKAKIAIISKAQYINLFEQEEDFRVLVLRQNAIKVESLLEQISILSFNPAKEVVHAVSDAAFIEFNKRQPAFLTHQELANLSGCARVTVSRAMSTRKQ